MSDNNEKELKYISPFKYQLLQSFPFIAEDFDQLTAYGLFCKLSEKMNEVVANNNNLNDDMIIYIQKFNALKDYVDNLDLQDEVNNKLDEMATDGTLAEIINAEIFNDLNSRVTNIESVRTIVIGDSYLRGDHNGISAVNGWGHYYRTTSGIDTNDFFSFAEGGAGFVKTGDSGHTFKTLLQANINSVTNKDTIKNVIICGGCNDREQNVNSLKTAISDMINYCKQQFPNCTVYIGMIGNNASISDETYRRNVINNSLYAYKQCVYYGAKYLTGVEYLLHNYAYFDDTDNTHPTQSGYEIIGKAIFNLVYNGVNLPFYQSTQLIGKQNVDWNSDFIPGSASTQMGFTSIINGTSKQVFINNGTCHITAENIHFSNNLLKLTDTLPFNLNYRNYYQNYTPGWAGALFIKFTDENSSRMVPGYYMIRGHALYFYTCGEDNKNITRIFVSGCNNNCDLLYT